MAQPPLTERLARLAAFLRRHERDSFADDVMIAINKLQKHWPGERAKYKAYLRRVDKLSRERPKLSR